jgi:hypothetical protein
MELGPAYIITHNTTRNRETHRGQPDATIQQETTVALHTHTHTHTHTRDAEEDDTRARNSGTHSDRMDATQHKTTRPGQSDAHRNNANAQQATTRPGQSDATAQQRNNANAQQGKTRKGQKDAATQQRASSIEAGVNQCLVVVDWKDEEAKRLVLSNGERRNCAEYVRGIRAVDAECADVFRRATEGGVAVDKEVLVAAVGKHWAEACCRYDEVVVVGLQWQAEFDKLQQELKVTCSLLSGVEKLGLLGERCECSE